MRDAMEPEEEDDEESSSSVKPPMIETDESDSLPNSSLPKNSLNTNSLITSSSMPGVNDILGQDSIFPSKESNQYMIVAQEPSPEESKPSPYG